MTLETLSVCPVCNNSLFHYFLTVKDYMVSQQDFQLVRCTICSLTFTNPRPTADTIPAYYKSEKYISHTGGSTSLMDTLYRIARGFTLKWKEKIVKSNSSENSLLDFGCGTGNFLAHMKSEGWNVTGIESASEARTKASENATVYKSLDEVATQFSAITLWHVLEHIHQLNPTLKELKQRLTPSGTIFIAVPNYKSCDAEHYKKYWAAYDVPRHLWHFDRQTMTQLLSNAGFKIQQTVPMKLDAYYVSLLSESYQNPKSNSLIKYFSAILQAWKANRSASKTGEFSSLIYIAKHS